MDCILNKCVWFKEGCCHSLGECGAAYALSRAREPGGYEVLWSNNKTIDGLIKAGLVIAVQSPAAPGRLIVKASNCGRAERVA